MQRKVTDECANCLTSFDHSIDNEIPKVRCTATGCEVDLCPCCPQVKCSGCDQPVCESHWLTFQGMKLCVACLFEIVADEPECCCMQTDVDLFDPRGCDLHDSSSGYNTLLRRITDVQRLEAQ